MDVVKTLQPGAQGTLRLQQQWKDQLVAVRYRKDTRTNTMLTTVEIIVETREINPTRRKPQEPLDFDPVCIRVGFEETELRERVKRHGARWNRATKLWELSYGNAKKLGLTARIVEDVSEY